MKTRSGFVSNSSSSSFIIAFDEGKFGHCPHCGRKDVSILDLVERANADDHDTQVEWSDATEHLNKLRADLKEGKAEVITLECMDPTHKVTNYWTAKEKADWLRDQNDELERRISLIQKALARNLSIAEVSISYHDEFLNAELQAQINSGKLELLSGEDN